MSNIKKSLEENLEHILGELPGKFHEDFKASLANFSEDSSVETEDELQQIKNELRYHPGVDADVVGEIDLESHKPGLPLSEEEQKKAMSAELERVRAEIT